MKRIIVLVVLVLALGAGAASLVYFQAASDTSDASDKAGASTDSSESGGGDGEGEDAAETDGEDDEADDGPTAVPVNVVDAAVGSVSTYITATSNLVPEDEVTVIAEVEGRVTELHVEEGDHVEAGQLLAALQQDEHKIAYDKARVQAANAEMAYERAQRMDRENLIAREEYDKLTMDHRVAQQEVAEAKWRLERAEIRAPFTGRVTWRNTTLGQHILPGNELFRVTQFDPLVSRIYLPEGDVLALDEGRQVEITLKADERVRFQGRIQRISPVVDTATGTVKVTIEAIDPPAVVRPGGFVIIDIVRETRAQALVLPREAVIRELKSAHVFVVKEDLAEKRSVEVGLEENEQLEILSGLEAGERVVVAGQGSLKDGSKIKILDLDDETTRAANEEGRDRLASEG
jgi:membrane fusion protein (multidrug efflux system)